ncbi:hypothetical protein [Celeribacter neptunius]|uniref:Dioxygenase n=1 Tax=Celeribacter neptunius TaxID=588602 RepID=A0A1I3J4Q0_9RHOB|nr:hypothetical protein [Celeribacter neptunius]SFI55242.1 Dioxygenase [Celeribacter neptunius]
MPHDHSDDDHDLGFQHDLPRMLGRRRLLQLMSGLGIASVAGAPALALDCVALPWETAGPFPADGSNRRSGTVINVLRQSGVIRRDVTASFGDYRGQVAGTALTLELSLQDHPGCQPLQGAAIYIWHCDADGAYSMYNVPEANWLRGLGVADAEGRVTFETIVPGCYPGRWPHIHFEVFESAEAAVSGAKPLLTSQLALPEGEIAAIYEADRARYGASVRNLSRSPLSRDGIFRNNSAAELAQQTIALSTALSSGAADGLSGRCAIPIAL